MRLRPPGSGSDSARSTQFGELFTDRESESQAFKVALSNFRREIDSDADAGVARRNVLVFHGLGGIGKTALSERLEGWVKHDLPLESGWGPLPATTVDATVRVDLHGSTGQMDVVAALLALRRGVATLRPRWPVFDLAFAAYWSAIRPGEALPTYRGRDDLTDSVVETLGDVLGDLSSLADVVGGGVGSGLAVRAVRKVAGDLRRRRDIRLALGAFEGFEAFLMRCVDEPSRLEPRLALACEIAGVLAWELSCVNPCPLLAVFVDTTERLALDPRRTSEGYLNAFVHQMPNVLFVMTGRDHLDWYDKTQVELPYRGARTWPGLVPGEEQEPRQHLVGGLSPQDARKLILRGREQLALPMPDDVVDDLVTASAGLPQYLELALQVAISIRDEGNGRLVEIGDVTGSLGSLVMRILEDVPEDEQRAIRAASLFRIFDADLIAAAANVDHGCAERAVERPMIDHHDVDRFPYRMHDAVREAIRLADHQVRGGWSSRDWQLAASRAVVAAREIHDRAKEREDNRGVLDAVAIAISLVCEQDTDIGPSLSPGYADWLAQAVVYSPSVQGLRSRAPGTSKTEYGKQLLNFIAAKSIETPIEERLRLLRSVFDSDHPLKLPAGRHLGFTLRQQARWDEALAVFDDVVRLAPTPLNLGQRPQTLSLARQFADALAATTDTAEDFLISPTPVHLRRMSEYAHGRPERYFDEIEEKVGRLRAAGRQRELLEEQSELLVRRAFFRGDLDDRELERFHEEADLAGHMNATRSGLLAIVLHHRAPSADVSAALERLRLLDQASAPGPVGFRYAMGEVCDALIAADRSRLVRLRDSARQLTFRNRSWIPIDCFMSSVGLPLPPVPTQWMEPADEVSARWTQHLDAYLARHSAPPTEAESPV